MKQIVWGMITIFTLISVAFVYSCINYEDEPDCPYNAKVTYEVFDTNQNGDSLTIEAGATHSEDLAIRKVKVNGVPATKVGFNFETFTAKISIRAALDDQNDGADDDTGDDDSGGDDDTSDDDSGDDDTGDDENSVQCDNEKEIAVRFLAIDVCKDSADRNSETKCIEVDIEEALADEGDDDTGDDDSGDDDSGDDDSGDDDTAD